jgi:hypothetical protein
MKSVTEHIRDHLLSNVLVTPVGDKKEDFDYICEAMYSEEFFELMRNASIMARFRYGLQTENKWNYDQAKEIIRRTKIFRKTGNGECLRDIATFAMAIFLTKNHPNYHFLSVDDGTHAEQIK